MTVKLVFFAQVRDRLGAGELMVTFPQGATVSDCLVWLTGRHPGLAELLKVSRLAVNCEYVLPDHLLRDADEVVVIPPVSGG